MTAMDLQDSVLRELRFDKRIDASHIGVAATDGGVVTLNGVVPSYLDKREAERAVKRVHGVRAVANDIEISLPVSIGSNDTELAERALDVLRWRSGVASERLRIGVSNGWVTIDGDVDFLFQKEEVERAVTALRGVAGVTNNLRVTPADVVPASDHVKREIRDALVRNARLDARGIDVKTEGSLVVLEGTVSSWGEAEEAESAAWFVPGVTAVDNRLQIGA